MKTKRFNLIPITLLLTLAAIVTLYTPVQAQITNPVKLVKGMVNEESGSKPIQGGGRLFVYQVNGGEIVNRSKINPSTGSFQLILDPSTTYRFVLLSPKYHTTVQSVTTPPGGDYEETELKFTMSPIVIGETHFTGRLFAANSAELKPSADLEKSVEKLKIDRAVIVTYTVKADGTFGKPAAPPKPSTGTKPVKGDKKSKGKKPVTMTPPTIPPPPPAPDTTASADVQIRMLVQKRVDALKAYMKTKGISLTQAVIRGDETAVPASSPNVVGVVSGVDTDIDYENVED